MKPIKVYISGPITLGDQAINIRNAIDAGDAVLSAGHMPYVPHLNHFWHMIYPHHEDQWMALDRAWLIACEALIRLPGASVGSDTEVRWATALAMPVFHSVQQFLDWSAWNNL